MNPQVQYRLTLLSESMQISGQFLLIRLHLKRVSTEERDELNKRADRLKVLIKGENL